MILINYLIVCLIFGTTFLFIKLGLEAGAPPFFSAGIRFFLAGAIVVAYFVIKKQVTRSFLFSKQLMVIGFSLTFMTFATLYWAEQYIDSGLAAVLSALTPITIMLILFGLKRTHLNKLQLIALLVALFGVGLICMPGISNNISIVWVVACLAVMVGQFFYGLGSILSKDLLMNGQKISPFLLNGMQMAYGGIMLIVLSLVVEQPNVMMVVANSQVMLSVLYLILIGSIGGHGLYYWLINQTNPVFPSTWLYISPLIALTAGNLFLDERLLPVMGWGAFLIIGGVFMGNFTTLRDYWRRGALLKGTNKV